jgi:GxxExxY protein
VYDGIRIEAGFRADLIVERAVILELKTLVTVLPVHHAQVLTYMRMSQIRKGLLLNFYAFPFTKGIKRFVL